jgi:hypothetical protein
MNSFGKNPEGVGISGGPEFKHRQEKRRDERETRRACANFCIRLDNAVIFTTVDKESRPKYKIRSCSHSRRLPK